MSSLCQCLGMHSYEIQNNNCIDHELRKDKRENKKIRILLLGTAATGKSTFLRGLRMVKSHDFDAEEKATFKNLIYMNILDGFMRILNLRKKLGLEWQEKDSARSAKELVKLFIKISMQKQLHYNTNASNESQLERTTVNGHHDQEKLIDHSRCSSKQDDHSVARKPGTVWISENQFLTAVPLLKKLYADATFGKVFDKMEDSKFDEESTECGKNLPYYMQQLHVIAVENYEPSNQHILHVRQLTTEVTETKIIVNKIPLIFIDLGGHTQVRREWNNVLKPLSGAITCIIYLIASSAFNEYYTKSDGCDHNNQIEVNKFEESLRCLRHIFDSKAALLGSDMSLIVFFNKDDLLNDKIVYRKIDFSKYDSTFVPPNDNRFSIDTVRNHLNKRLDNQLDDLERNSGFTRPHCYRHFTNSTDLNNVRNVFENVRSTALQHFLTQALPL